MFLFSRKLKFESVLAKNLLAKKNYNKHFHRKQSFKDETLSFNSNRVVIFILYQHRNFGIKDFYLILFYILNLEVFCLK